jgi:YQGE family putative transporter
MLMESMARSKQLPASVRSLVVLYWAYELSTSLTSVFIQIFLYQRFSDLLFNVLANMAHCTGVALGFCLPGLAISRIRGNVRSGFLYSFSLVAATMMMLPYCETRSLAFAAMVINGLGHGLFWLTIHTYELSEIKNHERDFYSSLLAAGGGIVSIAGPALATILIWMSVGLNWGDFTLLFFITPIFYCLGVFCFRRVNDYRPNPIEWDDLVHFFEDRKNRSAYPYLVGTAFQHMCFTIIMPLVIFFLLGNAMNVGLFATVLALFSAVCVLILSSYRTVTNRFQFLGVSSIGLAVLTAGLGFHLEFSSLILYGLFGAVLWPAVRVSIHVLDLQTMESMGRSGKDFYATMIFREILLWGGRMLGGIVLVGVSMAAHPEKSLLASGLYLCAASLIIVYVGAWSVMRSVGRER